MVAIKGYSTWVAAMFFTSFLAGMGILELPYALAQMGWLGLLLFAVAISNSIYGTILVGRTWILLENRWPQYKEKFRFPYPAMGFHAGGVWMRYFVTAVLHLSCIGVATVYVILVSEFLQTWTKGYVSFYNKYWILIVGLVLWPLTWFGSIEEFTWAGVGALGTVVVAAICILIELIPQLIKNAGYAYEDSSGISNVFTAFGIFLFAVSGTQLFPTIQNDMADRKKYKKAIFLGYFGLNLLYMPVAVIGYAVYGPYVTSNIISSFESGPLLTTISVCLTGHVFLAYLIVTNPIAQEVEDFFKIPRVFNYKRCIVRGLLVSLTTMIAYAMPHFDKIMSLIGGSTITLLTFVFPPIFYYRIQEQENKDFQSENTRKLPLKNKTALIQILMFGIVGFILSTYYAIVDIIEVFTKGDNKSKV